MKRTCDLQTTSSRRPESLGGPGTPHSWAALAPRLQGSPKAGGTPELRRGSWTLLR